MSKNRLKRTGILLLLIGTLTAPHLTALANTDSELDAAASKIDDLQEKQDEAEGTLDSLNDYKTGLTGDLAELDSQLNDISTKIDELTGQIDEKNTEITQKQADIEAMQKVADKQYEDMKKRIRFMYENGDQSVLSVLLSADSFADFLNQTEYVIAIQDYDRNKLTEYQDTQKQLVSDKQALETAKTELVAMQDELKTQQASVNTLIADKQAKISEANAQIEETKESIDAYEAQIAQQQAYEEKLERQKEAEEAARLAEIKRQEANDTPSEIVVAQGDQALLAALIECEAGGESYDGMLAVGSVVMNRVASSYFPNTVVGVIYQGGQFSPVASGRFATVLGRGASASCQQAAAEVLGGNRNVSCLYFRRNTGLIAGTVIGNHVFF